MKHLHAAALLIGSVGCGNQKKANDSDIKEVRDFVIKKELDLNIYCKTSFGSGFYAHVTDSNSVYGWSCQTDDNNRRSIDIATACDQQWGTKNFEFSNINDPYSWRCVVNARVNVPVYYGLDLPEYCKRNFGPDFICQVTNWRSAYGWACQRNINDRRTIDFSAVCEQQWGTTNVVSLNEIDPFTLRCVK